MQKIIGESGPQGLWGARGIKGESRDLKRINTLSVRPANYNKNSMTHHDQQFKKLSELLKHYKCSTFQYNSSLFIQYVHTYVHFIFFCNVQDVVTVIIT